MTILGRKTVRAEGYRSLERSPLRGVMLLCIATEVKVVVYLPFKSYNERRAEVWIASGRRVTRTVSFLRTALTYSSGDDVALDLHDYTGFKQEPTTTAGTGSIVRHRAARDRMLEPRPPLKYWAPLPDSGSGGAWRVALPGTVLFGCPAENRTDDIGSPSTTQRQTGYEPMHLMLYVALYCCSAWP